MPNYKILQKRKPFYRQCFRITMSMLYTGDNDDIPTFVFYGTQDELMHRVCQRMMRLSCGMYRSLNLTHRHVPRPRNGFVRTYHAVQVHGLNTRLMSVKDVALIFKRALQAATPCRVAQYPFSKFINS